MPNRLLILGASTRAAAHSALRAGIDVVCADMFADADLRDVAEMIPVSDYPAGLAGAARTAPPGPWMYTGALENAPDLIATISAERPLLGNSAVTLRSVRNPFKVSAALAAEGLPTLPLWPEETASPPPADGTWMLKPRRSAAGRGMRVWDAAADSSATRLEDHVFQRWTTGTPASAIFLGLPGRASFVGATRQLIGIERIHAAPFAFCGNIAPFRLPQRTLSTIERIGNTLSTRFGLRGLFGCDFLIDRQIPWLMEVNPRYTAAVEVIEHAFRFPLLNGHIQACESFERPARENFDAQDIGFPGVSRPHPARRVGRLILFARVDSLIGETTELLRPFRKRMLPRVADLPAAGDTILSGHPICSVFASAGSLRGCWTQLLSQAASFQSRYVQEKVDGAGGVRSIADMTGPEADSG